MRIAVVSRKGGVGKSTSAVHISAGLAAAGRRVLLVDVDTQGHCAVMLGAEPSTGLGSVILGQVPVADAICPIYDRLDLLAGGRDLSGTDRYIMTLKAGQERVLSRALTGIATNYDDIIIDCPPGFGVLSINAVTFADKILVPVSMEVLALYGLVDLEEEFAELRELGLDVELGWIAPTFVDRRVSKTGAILQQLRDTYGDKVLSPIRYSTRFSELAGHGQTIYEYEPHGRGTEDYIRLCGEVV